MSEQKPPLTDEELTAIEALCRRLRADRGAITVEVFERQALYGSHGQFTPEADRLGVETLATRLLDEVRHLRALVLELRHDAEMRGRPR